MKCLSIQQPWADLIIGRISIESEGIKDVENRTWTTKYRGPLLIHAGKKIDCEAMRYHGLSYTPRTGAILGFVQLTDIIENCPSPWANADCFHWLLEGPVAFKTPRDWKGQLGLFNVPDEVISETWLIKGRHI